MRNLGLNKGLVLSAVVALVLTACGSERDTGDDGDTVVATTTILGDLAANLVGDDGVVEVIMPVGADPHDFQASSAQVAAISRADLVVANGLGLEEGLEDVLDAAVADGVTVLQVAPLLDPIPFSVEHDEEGEIHDEEGESHDHEGDDPHVWLDPLRMGDAARFVARELQAIDATADWMARADAYSAELAALDADVVQMLSPIPPERRRLVTNHGALGYFADRYDFVIVDTVIPAASALADPSSEELAELIAVMETEQLNVIFADTTMSSELAEAMAAELGEAVEVVLLYTGSLDEPGSGADTLIGMLRANAERIAVALN